VGWLEKVFAVEIAACVCLRTTQEELLIFLLSAEQPILLNANVRLQSESAQGV
jgi:hypothetical protein